MQKMLKELPHILVVDDDQRIAALVCRYLEDHGYIALCAQSPSEARTYLEAMEFDALIVDVMMPEESGTEFTSSLQGKLSTPVLMLTAMGEVKDRIEGLKSGAEDYLAKPFDPTELLLRVQKLIARTQPKKEKVKIISFGAFQFDENRQQLLHQGENVELTSQELTVLSNLIRKKGIPITRDDLAELCGGINSRSIDVIMTRLRNKIETKPKSPVFLKTVWGKGYVFYS